MDRTPPGEGLPPSQDDIAIRRADLESAADAAGHFPGGLLSGARPPGCAR